MTQAARLGMGKIINIPLQKTDSIGKYSSITESQISNGTAIDKMTVSLVMSNKFI